MNILLINPEYPFTFWSFRHALKFISKKASFPPLGLLTVAAILPKEWNKRLVDLNVRPLKDGEIRWADYVFVGGMTVQKQSALEVIARCRSMHKKIVAGGPMFTAHYDEFTGIDHFVLNEAELTLPRFVEDIQQGFARGLYTSHEWADVSKTPLPLWQLINLNEYSSMSIQYSRGCPYDCEFCDITVLYGRLPRTKTAGQIRAELDALYAHGWRGSVFFVDDNFIGNRGKLKQDILPAIIDWMEQHRYPFTLNTEVSINLSDDEELMRLMARAGFDTVFVGIESPNEESLLECRKIPNRGRDLLASVRKIQRHGMQVQGGFIVGFDHDPASIFERMVEFIQESGIVTAMVGLLNAPRGSKLYRRLLHEGRLLSTMTGDNTDFSMNFIPQMDKETLLKGYQKIVQTVYSPKQYYARVKKFLSEYKLPNVQRARIRFMHIKALLKSIVLLGVIGKERFYYWRLFFWSLTTRPRLFPLAITFAIYGHHFRRVFEQHSV